LPRLPRTMIGAFTCICSKAHASATGSTSAFQKVSSPISTRSASYRQGLPLLMASSCAPMKELLADRGVQVVSNPTANLRLRSGVAPIASTIEHGGPAFAIGLDGTGMDDDQDLWREMRLLYLLHGGRGLSRQFTARMIFDAANKVGRQVINAPETEDFTIVDYQALTADALFDDIDEAEVLLTRMRAGFARGLFVAGREVMRDRKLTGLDFDAALSELLVQAKADLPRLQRQRPLVGALAAATRAYYGIWPGID